MGERIADEYGSNVASLIRIKSAHSAKMPARCSPSERAPAVACSLRWDSRKTKGDSGSMRCSLDTERSPSCPEKSKSHLKVAAGRAAAKSDYPHRRATVLSRFRERPVSRKKKSGRGPCFDFSTAPEEQRHQQKDGCGATRGSEPEGGPMMLRGSGSRAGGCEEIESEAGEQRARQHASAVSEERIQALGGATQVGRRPLVGIHLPGHEEEVEADSVKKNGEIEHPHSGTRIAEGEKNVAQGPGDQ